MRVAAFVCFAALIAGCASAPERKGPVSVASAGSDEEYAAAIKANSARSDHEPDGKIRAQLADQSMSAADACLAADPHSAACQYGKAIATGLQARAHPARAAGLLSNMLAALQAAEAVDPNYDNAGPARVQALVLIRSPGWPLGPGDADAGLVAARRAVSLRPDYPPNVFALAEALTKAGDEPAAHESYLRARDLALAASPGPEREDWLRDANEALGRK
jgi:tetratricopeptide (TPR) repeat protein